MSSSTTRLSARCLRGHLAGASGGVQLARLVAADPWTAGAIDHLPTELETEVEFVRDWAADLTDGYRSHQ